MIGRGRSAVVLFPAGGVSAPGGGDVDVVKVAGHGALRAVGRVVDATPNCILHPESSRVLEHVRDDLVSERDALGGAGVGNDHVERQTLRMPPQRIRSNATDLVNLGEGRADTASGQDGSDL